MRSAPEASALPPHPARPPPPQRIVVHAAIVQQQCQFPLIGRQLHDLNETIPLTNRIFPPP